MQNPKHSPLLELVAKKKLIQQTSQAVQQELPVFIGEAPETKDTTDVLYNDVCMLLKAVLSLSNNVNSIASQVQALSAKVASYKPNEHISGSLGIGNISGAKWRTEHAVELLANYTKKPWTKNKLLALSVAKGWRSAERGHKITDHMFVTTVVSKQYSQSVIVYTELALQHIIDNIDSCWTLATSVKV